MPIVVEYCRPIWIPKRPSIFARVRASHVLNRESNPTIVDRTHVTSYNLKLPPVRGEHWSLLPCSMLCTGGACAGLEALEFAVCLEMDHIKKTLKVDLQIYNKCRVLGTKQKRKKKGGL